MIYPPGKNINAGKILENKFVTADGTMLPLKRWPPYSGSAKAVLIAVHGFNDYSNFFQQPAQYFRARGIISYAYDQRGFGGSPQRGLWSGVDAYIRDLELFIQLVRQQHPGLPIFLLGESMGGAIVMLTAARHSNPPLAGIILAAPAVWSRDTMPWYQQLLLSTLAHTVPWLTVTGKGLDVVASDNIEMLIALGKDPQVIKETRIETIYGLANLMDAAYQQNGDITADTLILYGEKDEIVPRQPTYEFLQTFTRTEQQHKKTAIYPQGYHMLLRDLQAEIVWNDILIWMQSTNAALPSGADQRAQFVLSENGTKSEPAP